METVLKDGLVWPATDEICYDVILKDIPFMHEAISYCSDTRTCIQAGGNAGMYPVEFSKYFKRVLTFEPEPLNFSCLCKNIKEHSNVQPHKAVLGNTHQKVSIHGWLPNSGAWEIVKGSEGTGTIEQVRIDDLSLDDVDFIQLDVQGYEGNVLEGGMETILRCSPVIVLEEGYGPLQTSLLANIGYQAIKRSNPKNQVWDMIYVRNQRIDPRRRIV